MLFLSLLDISYNIKQFILSNIFVIVVTYNGVAWIEKCINSIAISTVPSNVIVIDNCSSDETVFLIKENYPWVQLVENKENLGFGKANNIGIKYAIDSNADFVLLLNQDAWLEPDTIGKLLDASLKNNDYWIFNPRLDQIINILPEKFFYHCAILILILVMLWSIILRLIYKKYKLYDIKKSTV